VMLYSTSWNGHCCTGKFNKTRVAPSQVPTLKQAMIWIARLGGYIARPTDPPLV
jgi:hypothetical protein